ncbi:hypothetical protein I3V78_30390 [Archangium primigenium]|nr:hypothetical protein [Archangium primigenium]
MDDVNPWRTRPRRRRLLWLLTAFSLENAGCAWLGLTPKRHIAWPDHSSTELIGAPMEAGAAIAAGAAVREMLRQNDDPGLFEGCSSPEQGLDVAVFKESGSGLYFVVLHQRFDRCGGPVGRVLDWWYEYAVTAQGEVLGEAPPEGWTEPPRSSPVTPPPAVAPGTNTPASDAPGSEAHPEEGPR